MSDVIEGEKHFTASVWITTTTRPKKILLIHHKKFDKWLQPGGHIERFENPVDAAVREVMEEIGLDISFLKSKVQVVDEDGSFLPVPEFVMEHYIPAKNGKPQHFHIDINYVVTIPEINLKHNVKELKNIGWFSKKEALSMNIHGDTRAIINKLLK